MIDQNKIDCICADLNQLRPGLGKLELAYALQTECRLRGLNYSYISTKSAVYKVLKIAEEL